MDCKIKDPAFDISQEIAIYIHIPFCQTKCPYCDFNTYSGIETLIPGYTKALVAEIHLWGSLLNNPLVSTVFFGGGTPSYVPSKDIRSILEATRSAFRVQSEAEISMEANPGDLSLERVKLLPIMGINRLSIGVQSFNDSLLHMLGRRHSSEDAVEAYGVARRAGFTNISLDLMYGLPHQTLDQWRDTLNKALYLYPEHLSLYCLTLEDGTPMEKQVRLSELPQPDSDLAADMYLLAEELLAEAKYHHYEISNWSQDSMESRHNLTYWHNNPYLGVGPGAHSYLNRNRFHNVTSPGKYIRLIESALPPSSPEDTISAEAIRKVPTVDDIETIEQPLEMAETMMLWLRLNEGVSLEAFAERFGKTLPEIYGEEIRDLISIGLLEQLNGVLRLTGRGRLLGNEVFLRFFSE